jgi:hypothetical protein
VEVYEGVANDGTVVFVGDFPVHDGELVSRGDFSGLPESSDCLFRSDAEIVCPTDGSGGPATLSVDALCSDHCIALPDTINVVGSVTNTALLFDMKGVPVLSSDGKYLFVPDEDFGVVTLDITTTKTSPTIVGSLAMLGARDILLSPDGVHAFVSCFDQDQLVAVDVTDPAQITVVATFADKIGNSIFGAIWQVGTKTYVGIPSTNSLKGLSIIDVTDAANMQRVGNIAGDSRLAGARDAVYDADRSMLWVACGTTDTILGVKVSDPASPTIVSSLTSGTCVWCWMDGWMGG